MSGARDSEITNDWAFLMWFLLSRL